MKHIFITGCPRSGTTMLASMLGSDSNSIVTPESDFFIEFIYKYLSKQSDSVKISKYLRFLNQNYRFKQWQIETEKIKELPEEVNFTNFKTLVENTVSLFAEKQLNDSNKGLLRIDHTPSSIRYFDILVDQFPKSKFIFIIRDPRAVYASVKDLDWGANTALKLCEIWNEYVTYYFCFEKLFPNRICLVKYEDILTSPELHLKRLCDFINIQYNDSMIHGKGFIIPGYTASQHVLVGKKLDQNRIEKWKNELSFEDILIIESKCKSIMKVFDYSISQNTNYQISAKQKGIMILSELYSYLKNKFRKKRREQKA
ncbi:sulfotransferase family protein [Hanstruepera flava]|uniref:sulfotransferase family protein n=1 Tax=Hanstruepera flava TaxID=2930218 RepID=UPI00202922A0|nr:sulfotransferase [Hanstruepera flava]